MTTKINTLKKTQFSSNSEQENLSNRSIKKCSVPEYHLYEFANEKDKDKHKQNIIKIMVKYIIMFPKTLKDKNIEIILFELLAQYDFILGGTDEGTKVCGGKRHPGSKSPFPVNRVPLEYFEKKGKEELLKTCLHCREKQKLADNRYKKKMKELAKDVKEKGDGKFLACPSKEHLTKVKSKFPRDKVPINLFQSEPNNPKIIC